MRVDKLNCFLVVMISTKVETNPIKWQTNIIEEYNYELIIIFIKMLRTKRT